ncbi:hypothetical protein BS78_06G208600 [Paspalum vaginatum]|nr:hypothetical protein BS78_06G208600 [Paspalum vaginatum]
MDDNADELAGRSQVHGCSSYPLSFPSQPPDIKNWFSSYEYESPEVPELAAHPDSGNGSETQDPFEHSSFKHSLRDGGFVLRENCLGGRSEPEFFAGAPVDESALKVGAKRKQSLWTLFGADFLDWDEEATETDIQCLLPVQRNELEPLPDCTRSLPDTTKQSQEGTIEHMNVLVDCDHVSSVDTEESNPTDLDVESKTSFNCDDARLSDIETGFAEHVIDQIELPVTVNGTNITGTEINTQDGVERSIGPVSLKSISLDGTEETGLCNLAMDSEKSQQIVSSDGFITIKRKERQPDERKMNKIPRHPIERGREEGELQENNGISGQKVLVQEQTRRALADRTNESEATTIRAPEIGRKWKCPRKDKPYVGRPMRQLRLEQWVRRVN